MLQLFPSKYSCLMRGLNLLRLNETTLDKKKNKLNFISKIGSSNFFLFHQREKEEGNKLKEVSCPFSLGKHKKRFFPAKIKWRISFMTAKCVWNSFVIHIHSSSVQIESKHRIPVRATEAFYQFRGCLSLTSFNAFRYKNKTHIAMREEGKRCLASSRVASIITQAAATLKFLTLLSSFLMKLFRRKCRLKSTSFFLKGCEASRD